MKILTENGYVKTVGVFFELDDEQLQVVMLNKDYYMSRELLEEFNKSTGNNAHFFGLCNNGSKDIIYKNIKALLEKYKTVSWWDKDMNEFKLTGR